MIVALLISISLACWSGMELYAEEGKGPLAGVELQLVDQAQANGDREDEHDDGDGVWEEIHEVLANLTLLLVLLHISGVVVSSVLHRENLVRAMITGYKKPD